MSCTCGCMCCRLNDPSTSGFSSTCIAIHSWTLQEHYQPRLCDRVIDSAALRLKLMSLYCSYWPLDLYRSVRSSPVLSDPALQSSGSILFRFRDQTPRPWTSLLRAWSRIGAMSSNMTLGFLMCRRRSGYGHEQGIKTMMRNHQIPVRSPSSTSSLERPSLPEPWWISLQALTACGDFIFAPFDFFLQNSNKTSYAHSTKNSELPDDPVCWYRARIRCALVSIVFVNKSIRDSGTELIFRLPSLKLHVIWCNLSVIA